LQVKKSKNQKKTKITKTSKKIALQISPAGNLNTENSKTILLQRPEKNVKFTTLCCRQLQGEQVRMSTKKRNVEKKKRNV